METIKEMIARMCPEGIEKIYLNQVADIGTGSSNRQDSVTDGKYAFFVRSKEVFKSSTYEFDEEAILIPGEGGIGDIFHYYKGKYALHQRTYRIHVYSQSLNTRFLFYYMSLHFKEYIMKKAVAATVTSIRKPMIEFFEIPLPPLPIQQEIVRILDSFTSLQSNLEAELTARQKQYEHYRNELLTFDKNDKSVEWKKLGEIGQVLKGKGIQKADFVEEGKPCIHYGQVHTYYGFSATETKSFISESMFEDSNKAHKGDLIIATTSEDVEACCKATVWLGDEEVAISGDAHYYRHNQNPKYVGYLFMTDLFAAQKRIAAVGAKVTRVHGKSIEQFELPFPSLQRQQEIVNILDTFEALISNLKQEIEARKKQYEYYRNKLLTF